MVAGALAHCRYTEADMTGSFGSAVLDVAIGLGFVYLLLSIMCTTVNEWISSLLKSRAKNLKAGIRQLLDGQPTAPNGSTTQFLTQFYEHPVVTGMMKGEGHPSYMPARSFATTVMDLVTPAVPGTITFPALE